MNLILSKNVNGKNIDLAEFTMDDFGHMLIDFLLIEDKINKKKFPPEQKELEDYISQLLGEEEYAECLVEIIEKYTKVKDKAHNSKIDHQVMFRAEEVS